jgi:hypothetical protein
VPSAASRARRGCAYEESLTKLSQKFAYHPAIRYAPSRWVAVVRYGDEGRVEIDNNAAERTIRTAALGREEPVDLQDRTPAPSGNLHFDQFGENLILKLPTISTDAHRRSPFN